MENVFDDDRFMGFNTLKMNRSLITHLYNNIKDKTGIVMLLMN